MSRIAMMVLPEPGHINRTLRLYEELTASGHEVRFLASQGDVAIFERCALPTVEVPPLPAPTYRCDTFSPDLALIDVSLPEFSMWAWRQGVSVLNLSTTFSFRYDPNMPPLTTGLLPAKNEVEQARIDAAWMAERERHRTVRKGHHLSAIDWHRRMAKHFDFPLENLDEQAASRVVTRFPEIMLVPAELDFPRGTRDDRTYAGACVDVSRSEAAIHSLDQLPDDRPLVYCSVGTQIIRYPVLLERIALLAEAGRLMPHVTMVIACAAELPAEALPRNVLAWRHAPQLALLRRAAVMVSHGGSNGVTEALVHGVPLVVLPFDKDQPGIAARVVHHGVGRSGDWEGMSAATLAATIRNVLEDPSFADRSREMGASVASSRPLVRAARWIECHLPT